ncbi:ATP synthase F0 subunit B [Streptomyces fuscigenes]|uniref:ATP synthase F0 subunit B n=1 Tax=Streptomyces fuscigenes TaxID=1528880 RepID=UPI001F3C8060|nr:ATP synthase F0 subunit B [Streptomyces fuscigenes]MCF3962729.1 ATP synthase F0 subunit B [Streptomyces fuscigenes]
MDVQKKLDEIVDAVGNARSMPMSASCVVNRAELLAMLEEVRSALPGSLAQAEEVIGGHEQLAAQARQEADRIIQEAHAQRSALISDTVVARQSQDEADRILSDARRDAEEIRAEADDYVDSKLANFEVVLTKTIGSVDRGREKLLGRTPGEGPDGEGAGYDDDPDAPEYSDDPSTLIRRADDYVDVKLGAFEAVLSKTLEAVGRGRQKLHGRIATDDLGAHMAAQDASGGQGLGESDFLSDLADIRPPARERPAPRAVEPAAEPAAAEDRPMIPANAQQPYQDGGYAGTGYETGSYDMGAVHGMNPDGTGGDAAGGYQATGQGYGGDQGYGGYGQQDAYGYQQQDPYAYQQGGYDPAAQGAHPDAYGQDGQGYGWQQDPGQQHDASHQQHDPSQQGQAALDETSFFDTSMIDMEALRRYEEGR